MRALVTLTLLSSIVSVVARAQPAADDGFDKIAHKFLKSHCVACHGKDAESGFRIDDLLTTPFDPADNKRWQNIVEMVDVGEMPPKERPQPSGEARAAFKQVVGKQLAAFNVGKNEWEKELPRYANRVDHDALFSGEHKGPAYTPARVWRINGDIYQRLMKDFELGFDFVIPLQNNTDGFYDYSRLYADEATIRTMKQNAKRVATAFIRGRHIKPTGAKERDRKERGRFAGSRHKPIIEFVAIEGEPNRQQMEQVMAFVYHYITKLRPTEAEIDRWIEDVMIPNIKAGGNEQGLHGTIVAVLLSPEFLFRVEVGQGKELPDGRRMLSSTELAFALSYTLHNHPVKTMLAAAEQGNLETKADVEREFRKLYDDPRLLRGSTSANSGKNVWQTSKDHRRGTYSRPRLVQFFQQYFGYTKAPDIFKDDLRHGGKHNPSNLIKDADWTVLHVLAKDQNVLEELLTTDHFAVPKGKPNKKRKKDADSDEPVTLRFDGYLAVYNLTEAPTRDRSVEMSPMPGGQRAGMLTHPAWLVAHSLNFHTDPVRRGKWILGHLLGYDVPELPIAVQAQLPEWHDKTIRERFSVVKNEACWRCHKKMNPLGEVFEAYDDFGRYRTHHLVGSDGNIVETEFERQHRFNRKSVTGATPKIPVDMTGELFGTGNPELDGPVKDPIELVHKLAKSERVRQVFIRHVFRYWMGRNETLDDSPTLMAMDKAYLDSGGSLKETLVALVTSDSFLYRK